LAVSCRRHVNTDPGVVVTRTGPRRLRPSRAPPPLAAVVGNWTASECRRTSPRGWPAGNSSFLNTTVYQFRREFSLTEGAARGTRGHLGPGGRDQRGLVGRRTVLELGPRPGSRCG